MGAQVKFLTTEEVAEMTRRSIFTVRRWIREGRLKAVKVGGRLLIEESSFLDFLSGQPLAAPDELEAGKGGKA